MRTFNKIFFFLSFLILLFLSPDAPAQCAMCKQAAESTLSNPNSLARDLNTGILYLMAVPYLALCFIFRKQLVQIYRKIRAKMSARMAG